MEGVVLSASRRRSRRVSKSQQDYVVSIKINPTVRVAEIPTRRLQKSLESSDEPTGVVLTHCADELVFNFIEQERL